MILFRFWKPFGLHRPNVEHPVVINAVGGLFEIGRIGIGSQGYASRFQMRVAGDLTIHSLCDVDLVAIGFAVIEVWRMAVGTEFVAEEIGARSG